MKNLILTLVFVITTLVSFSQSDGSSNYKYTVSTTINTIEIDTTCIVGSDGFATYSYDEYTVYILDTDSIVHINFISLTFEDSLFIDKVYLNNALLKFETNYDAWDTLIIHDGSSYDMVVNINHDSLTSVDTVFVQVYGNGYSQTPKTWFKIVKISQYDWEHLGVNDLELTTTRLSAYPNPASSNITIDFDVTTNEVPVAIFSMNGQLVYSNDDNRNNGTNSLNVDVSSFQTGIYIVKAGSQTFKFVKQ